MHKIQLKTLLLAILALLIGPTSASFGDTPTPGPAGTVIRTEHLGTTPANGVRQILRRAGIASGHAWYGVVAYRLIYSTTSIDGSPTRASALVALPLEEARPTPERHQAQLRAGLVGAEVRPLRASG